MLVVAGAGILAVPPAFRPARDPPIHASHRRVMKTLIQLGGLVHFGILIASALTPGVLEWRRHLAGLPPLLRQLFWVYGSFIVLVIISFGAISITQPGALASGEPLARAICAMIAVFWSARLAVQWFVFDADAVSHERLSEARLPHPHAGLYRARAHLRLRRHSSAPASVSMKKRNHARADRPLPFARGAAPFKRRRIENRIT